MGCTRSQNGTTERVVFEPLLVVPYVVNEITVAMVIVSVVLGIIAILLLLFTLRRWHSAVRRKRIKLNLISHDFIPEHTEAVSLESLYIYIPNILYIHNIYLYAYIIHTCTYNILLYACTHYISKPLLYSGMYI